MDFVVVYTADVLIGSLGHGVSVIFGVWCHGELNGSGVTSYIDRGHGEL